MLHPTAEFVTVDGRSPHGLNNGSVALRLDYGGTRVLVHRGHRSGDGTGHPSVGAAVTCRGAEGGSPRIAHVIGAAVRRGRRSTARNRVGGRLQQVRSPGAGGPDAADSLGSGRPAHRRVRRRDPAHRCGWLAAGGADGGRNVPASFRYQEGTPTPRPSLRRRAILTISGFGSVRAVWKTSGY